MSSAKIAEFIRVLRLESGYMKPYRRLIEEVDELAAKLSARYSNHLQCGAGCSGCCRQHISVFAVEADELKAAVSESPAGIREVVSRNSMEVREAEARGEGAACPLLVDDRCSVYESRPLICRTQGLPLLIEAEDGSQEVDFCPLNFAEPGATEDLEEDYLVPLDELNLKLAMINLDYCREHGIDVPGERIKLAEIVLTEKTQGV